MKALYLDVQNLHRKTLDYGRIIDRKKFFVYCKEKYHIDRIYFAVGFLSKHQSRYNMLVSIGYTMLFKETILLPNGDVKGNVDIDIAIQSIMDIRKQGYQEIYLATNDGDFNTLVQTLINEGIPCRLIVPDRKTASQLLKKFNCIVLDLQDIKTKIQKIA